MSQARPAAASRHDFGYRCALALNGGLALALAAVWLSMAARGLFWRADFSAFYTGWAVVLDGQGPRLYDLNLQADYQRRVLPERGPTDGVLPFTSPPTFAVSAAPLALLPRPAAFYAWAAFQLGLLALAARSLGRLACDWGPPGRRLLLAGGLAFPPTFMTFQMGQLSLLVLVCWLGFARALREGRPSRAAFWLVLGTVKPQLMVVPAVVLLAGRRWRELGLAAALFGAWALLAAAVLGASCWVDFLNVLRHSARQFGTSGINPQGMYNVKGLLTGLLGAERAALINALSAAALLLAVGLTVALWRRPPPPAAADFDLRLALALLAGLIANPHFNPVDALALLVPAVLFLGHLRRRARPWRALAALLAACPLLFLIDCYCTDPRWLGARPFFLLMVGLALWMAWELAGARGAEAPRPDSADGLACECRFPAKALPGQGP
jgi:hypothetical protein